MKNLILLLAAFLAVTASAADLQINDPTGILDTLDTFVGHPTFENAFVCGTQAKYLVNHCDAYGHCGPSTRTTETVSDCSADSVTLHADTSDTADWIITRVGYEAANGDLLRADLANMAGNWGPRDYVDVQSYSLGTYTIDEQTHVDFTAVELVLNFYVQAPNGAWGYQRIPLEIGVGTGIAAAAELIWAGSPGTNLPPAYQLLSFTVPQ